MAETTGDLYTLRQTVPFGDDEGTPAGTVRIDGAQMIEIVAAEPGFADKLELAADTLNETDEFELRAMPPPDRPRTSYRRLVPRDAPDARDAVVEALRADYGFEAVRSG